MEDMATTPTPTATPDATAATATPQATTSQPTTTPPHATASQATTTPREDTPAPDADPDGAPLTSWEGFDIGLPDNVLDPAALASFGKAAVDMGLTPKQARALAQWQTGQIARARERLLEAGHKELERAWGEDCQRNREAVLGLVARIDRMTGDDAFSRALGESGAACFPGVARGLYAVASLLAEDSTGAAAGAASSAREESPLDGLTNALREARAAHTDGRG